jgi:hypothetical protein
MDVNDSGHGSAAGAGLQFETAEIGASVQRACKRCKGTIVDEYFESSGHILCASCAETLGANAGGGADFLRAFAYGAGAAILGTMVWFGIMKSLDRELGIVAIAVGLLVGIAVRRGSLGRGGRKYQVLAMALTYVSITSSYVPFVVQGMVKGAHEEGVAKVTAASPDSSGPSPSIVRAKKQSVTVAGLLLFFAMVFALAFAAPFLAGFSNVMGIVIIGIALYEAWKINRHVPISGPFRLAPRARAGPVALAPPGAPLS